MPSTVSVKAAEIAGPRQAGAAHGQDRIEADRNSRRVTYTHIAELNKKVRI
jgi:hypothetical protein